MKIYTPGLARLRASLLFLMTLLGASFVSSAALFDSFLTYQGRLEAGGASPDPEWLFDFRFSLFDVPTGGTRLTTPVTHLSVPCPEGLFTVPLDFGSNVFTGEPLWLQIEVRPATNSTTTPYTLLNPRQQITSAPYAIHAAKADLVADGSVRFAQLAPDAVGTINLQTGAVTGGKIADGNVVRSLNGLKDTVTLAAEDGLMLTTVGNELRLATSRSCTDYTNCYWNLLGNGNTVEGVNFLGTINAVPLELKVNNQRVLRVEYTGASPNLIGGRLGNMVVTPSVGGVIAGGGEAANPNILAESYGVIGGGSGHMISIKSLYSVIGGGLKNTVSTNSAYSTIGGGDNNFIHTNAPYSTIAGGRRSTIQPSAQGATISGGAGHLIGTNAWFGTIGGGTNNSIQAMASGSSIAGGANNSVSQMALFGAIGGGRGNLVQPDASLVSISGGEANLVGTNSDYSSIAGGSANVVVPDAPYASVPGGQQARARVYGQLAYAGGQFGTNGDAQLSFYVVRRSIPTATTAELFLDGDAATRRITVPSEATWTFDVLVSGRSDGGASAGYRIIGVIKNVAGATSLVGVPVKSILAEEIPGWDAFVEADNVNDALVVKVVGDLVPSRWVATVHTSEVIY